MRVRFIDRAIVGLLAGAIAVAIVPAASVVATGAETCVVTNTRTGATDGTLAAAVTAAKGGDELTVRGVCRGTTSIGKDLTIRGIRPAGAAAPTLDGKNLREVVGIEKGAKVTMKRLLVTRGVGISFVFATVGGGIVNSGTLVLRGVRVALNNASVGGGIFNGGRLTLGKGTIVTDNHAWVQGGGVANSDGATVIIRSTGRISSNQADERAGGLFNPTGALLDGVRCPGPFVFNAKDRKSTRLNSSHT